MCTKVQLDNISRQIVQSYHSVYGSDIVAIYLYGSYARGDYTESSDIDMMILTTLRDEDISEVSYQLYDLAFDYQMEHGVDISVIIKNEEQFNYWLGALPFYDNVKREGVIING